MICSKQIAPSGINEVVCLYKILKFIENIFSKSYMKRKKKCVHDKNLYISPENLHCLYASYFLYTGIHFYDIVDVFHFLLSLYFFDWCSFGRVSIVYLCTIVGIVNSFEMLIILGRLDGEHTCHHTW